MIAAGPAATAAFRAPKSQPEPMIEPTLANSSPTTPTWRLSCGLSVVDEVDWVSVDMCTFSFTRGRARSGRDRPNTLRYPAVGTANPGRCAIMHP